MNTSLPRQLSTALALLLVVPAALLAAPPATIGKGEGALDILAWPGYIERGESDKAYDWVSGFEKDSGCTVRVKQAASSDEMVTLMNNGKFDLVTASGDASLRLIAGKKVQEINIKLIPGWNAIDPRFQQAAWHTVDGKHYGVPFQWGPNLLAYSEKVFPKAPDSWAVVFEPMKLPDGKPNQGRVQAFDGPIYMADAALYLMSKRPELGIKDPYELNETQYQAVLALLRQQRKLVTRYWHDANVQVQDFTSEGLAASSTWPFQVNTLRANKQKVAAIVPKEGVTGWADTTMMHANASHPNCAYKWMAHSLESKLQGDLAAWFGSVPVVQAACSGNALLGAQGCATNGLGKIDQIHFWKTPQSSCATQGRCVPYNKWSTDYIAIMGAH
jgi:putative spermidine/putrescine transport system substrate-binding protein